MGLRWHGMAQTIRHVAGGLSPRHPYRRGDYRNCRRSSQLPKTGWTVQDFGWADILRPRRRKTPTDVRAKVSGEAGHPDSTGWARIPSGVLRHDQVYLGRQQRFRHCFTEWKGGLDSNSIAAVTSVADGDAVE